MLAKDCIVRVLQIDLKNTIRCLRVDVFFVIFKMGLGHFFFVSLAVLTFHSDHVIRVGGHKFRESKLSIPLAMP